MGEHYTDITTRVTGPSRNPVVGADLYFFAIGFASWAGFRLPSEHEWEKAARGLDGHIYPWGDTFSPEHCNTAESGPGTVTPVDAYPGGKSIFGCWDMMGNIQEWTTTETGYEVNMWSHCKTKGGSFAEPLQRACDSDYHREDFSVANVGIRFVVDMPDPMDFSVKGFVHTD